MLRSSLAAAIKSIVEGGSLFSLLQSARSIVVLPSVGTIFTGAIKSIVHGGNLFSLLQSARSIVVLPSVGTIFTGAIRTAATGARVAMATNGQPGTSNSGPPHQAARSIARCDNPDDDDGNPPPVRTTVVPEEYILAPPAILAIAKAWDVGTYDPPGTNCTSWLSKVRISCERYGVPVAQRAHCAMHHMRTDCREAARTAGCYDMTWDEFTTWLRQYDRRLHILMLGGVPC